MPRPSPEQPLWHPGARRGRLGASLAQGWGDHGVSSPAPVLGPCPCDCRLARREWCRGGLAGVCGHRKCFLREQLPPGLSSMQGNGACPEKAPVGALTCAHRRAPATSAAPGLWHLPPTKPQATVVARWQQTVQVACPASPGAKHTAPPGQQVGTLGYVHPLFPTPRHAHEAATPERPESASGCPQHPCRLSAPPPQGLDPTAFPLPGLACTPTSSSRQLNDPGGTAVLPLEPSSPCYACSGTQRGRAAAKPGSLGTGTGSLALAVSRQPLQDALDPWSFPWTRIHTGGSADTHSKRRAEEQIQAPGNRGVARHHPPLAKELHCIRLGESSEAGGPQL